MRSFLIALCALCFSSGAFASQVIVGHPAPNFSTQDYNGAAVHLSDYKGSIVVLEWTNPECPFVRRQYGTGLMQRVQSYARENHVVWLTINSSANSKEGYMRPRDVKQFYGNRLISDHYILDHDGSIGKLYGAKTTPVMFVIDPSGTLVYSGAIDDKPTADMSNVATPHNYVKAAIDNLLAHAPVIVSSTQSYGCSVKYAD